MDARRAVVIASALLMTGCAYFNTLYNAKDKYKEAEKASLQREAQQATNPNPQDAVPGRNPQQADYEKVIEKCRNVIARYPKSRHVDDAMLLIAKSLYRLQRYEEAAAALDSLESRFPKTNLLADARFLKGKSLVAAEHYDVAAHVLSEYADQFRKHHDRAEGLYLLCTCQMQLSLSEAAVATLHRLEKDHGRSDYRFRAQVEMARILAEKNLYKESLAVYQRLSETRIPERLRYDVWLGKARVQAEVGDYAGALATLAEVRKLVLSPDREPAVLLMVARAHAGADSTDSAIKEYKQVVTRFARGAYGAEANFRLGQMYEAQDSLTTAQKFYQSVPTAYSGSEFADEAIRKSADIGRILKIQATAGDDSPEAVALRTFSMAEVQFFQFENAEKAIPSYEKVVNEFGDSEYAPKAAYALGYIYGVVLADSAKAREWYDVLRTRYADTQQAMLAYAFYKGATPPPPLSEMARFIKAPKAQPAPAGGPENRGATRPGVNPPVPPPIPPPEPAWVDSLRDPDANPTPASPDTSR